MQLREYQVAVLDQMRAEIRAGNKSVLLCAPTGSGKTVIATELIRLAVAKGSHVLALAHRKELIDQFSDKLDTFGIDHGIVKAGNSRIRPSLPVQVASVQTLVRRTAIEKINLIVHDEAHHSRAASHQKILSWYPDAVHIGLTATPVRGDGKGLGGLFTSMVQCPGVPELTRLGYLVPIRTWSAPQPDLRGIRKTAGDYQLDELASRMDKPALIGHIVDHWRRIAQGRPTVVFAVNIEHSRNIAAQFNFCSIKAEHLDGNTPEDERAAILKRLHDGETQVVVNCQVLSEGWDSPPVSCIILARPTMSMGLYLQMAGRALRPYDNKRDCILIDHAGSVYKHGLVNMEREWTLQDDPIRNHKAIKLNEDFKVCPKCMAVAKPADERCPECGYIFAKKRKQIIQRGGELSEVGDVQVKAVTESRKRSSYEHGLWIAATQMKKDGTPYKPGWAAFRFKQQFGYWPPSSWKQEWLAKQSALDTVSECG